VIRLAGNENPVGPGDRVVATLAASAIFVEHAGGLPPTRDDLRRAVAAYHHVDDRHVVVGAGSQELLRNAVVGFSSPARGVVAGAPTFETCVDAAHYLGYPVTAIAVDHAYGLRVDAMASAAAGAGVLYFSNPNNPTATVHSRDTTRRLVESVRRRSPDTIVVIDEAYYDYVTDRSFASAIDLALDEPHVVVTRTFSKARGMAGLRVGYAIGARGVVARLEALAMPRGVSGPALAAAIASLADEEHVRRECARNGRVRAFVTSRLTALGCTVTASQANFVFADLHRNATRFRERCAAAGVLIGRPFAPFGAQHVRISLGTMDEMQQALPVFAAALSE
jgi:histidinol-phosphate aminotransferase